MAAKPPRPPATLLKQKSPLNSDQSANGSNNSSTTSTTTPTTPASPVDETFSKLGIRRYNSRDNLLNNISNDNNNSDFNGTSAGAGGTTASGSGANARPTCNCTNISIMHLFHEMKQEFPTIPDPIVAQCVNENCHQRENCIQMLRNELALNPIPVQTYPAKVLQQHHINQQQQQQQQQRALNSPQLQKRSQSLTPTSHPQPPQRHKNASATKPATLLRPVRAAPTQPPPPQFASLQRQRADTKTAQQLINCDSGELVKNNNNNSNNLLKDVSSVQTPVCNNHNNSNNSVVESSRETCDMPAPVTTQTNAGKSVSADCARSSDFIAALNKAAAKPPPLTATRPRPRPNTLDLHTAQQQLQRQQLNKQLQQHLQQRCQSQQQQTQLPTDDRENTPPQQQKPMRRAPLPPIAPKPVFNNNNNTNHNQYNNYNNNNSCGNSPQSQSGGSCSAESNLTSPISSCGESDITANIGLSTQNFARGHINNNRNNNNNHNLATSAVPPPPPLAYQQHNQQPLSPLKSPIRHRSVINVQPEPPYTRDFITPTKLNTGALATSSNSSTPTSQKSFTSVNLTLRQPTAAAVPQSTIDISAGPASSGYGSGLTYSSTSFDARRGYQQNFHITVTDEGGVFNASRIRPRTTSGYYSSVEERDSPCGSAGGGGGGVRQTTSSATPTSGQDAAYMLAQNITQQAIQSKTATIISPTRDEDMCVPYENNALAETIRRQKTRRDKLATALRDNKQKLGHVEEEINMLTETLSPGESERLDYEIERLRNDCQQMLNEIENIRRYGQLSDVERLQLQQQQQQQQQPFPRQRPPRPTQQTPQSTYPHQQQIGLISIQQQQHHTAGSNLGNVSGITTHNSIPITQNSTHLLPTTNSYQQRQNYTNNHQTLSTDEEDYSDSNTEGGDDDADDDEPLERWPCSMCTFLNHPQLNICEACECVRILPGTVRIVHTAGGNAATAATTPHPASLMASNSATAAAAAAALAAAAPTVLGPRGPVGSSVGYAGVGAVGGSNAASGSSASSTSARPAAAARPVAAE